jgi:hypothetical protein
MTDASLFNEWAQLQKMGGRLAWDGAAGEPIDKGYEGLVAAANSLVSSARGALPRLPKIHFDIFDCALPNAVAFLFKDRYFVGMTVGLRYLIESIIYRMLSDPRAFPNIGDPSKESEPQPLPYYRPDVLDMINVGAIRLPKSQRRFDFAAFLIQKAVMFLVAHEITHIAHGHLAYLQSTSGTGTIAEFGFQARSEAELIENQALELDADAQATSSGIDSIIVAHTYPNTFKPSWSPGPVSVQFDLFAWAFAANSLFRILGEIPFSPLELPKESYPPNPMRRMFLIHCAWVHFFQAANLVESEKPRRDSFLDSLRRGSGCVQDVFGILLNTPSSLKILETAYQSESIQHLNRVLKYWNDPLRRRLVPHSFDELSIYDDELAERLAAAG